VSTTMVRENVMLMTLMMKLMMVPSNWWATSRSVKLSQARERAKKLSRNCSLYCTVRCGRQTPNSDITNGINH